MAKRTDAPIEKQRTPSFGALKVKNTTSKSPFDYKISRQIKVFEKEAADDPDNTTNS